MPVNEKTKASALKALDGMREIVKNEMLVRGEYVEDEVKRPDLEAKGAVCNGRRHCAIGSLWVGAGVEYTIRNVSYSYVGDENEQIFDLPGTGSPRVQRQFVARRPGLKLAYETLNQIADEWIERNPAIQRSIARRDADHFVGIERLFEGAYGTKAVGRDDMLKIITTAKRRVKKLK